MLEVTYDRYRSIFSNTCCNIKILNPNKKKYLLQRHSKQPHTIKSFEAKITHLRNRKCWRTLSTNAV